MPLYESVFIARQDIPAQEVEALAERFASVLAEQGGEVARREYWGLKNMAYRIKKNRKGHYTMLHIDAPATAVQEMERTMRISEDVLRYMSMRIDALPEGPSIMMQTRAAREDRRRDERRARAARRREEESRAAAASAAAEPSTPAASGAESADAPAAAVEPAPVEAAEPAPPPGTEPQPVIEAPEQPAPPQPPERQDSQDSEQP